MAKLGTRTAVKKEAGKPATSKRIRRQSSTNRPAKPIDEGEVLSSDPEDMGTYDLVLEGSHPKWGSEKCKQLREGLLDYMLALRHSQLCAARRAQSVYKRRRVGFFESLRDCLLNLESVGSQSATQAPNDYFGRFVPGAAIPAKPETPVPKPEAGTPTLEDDAIPIFDFSEPLEHHKLWRHICVHEAPVAHRAYAQQSSSVTLMLKRNAQAMEREVKRVQQRLQKQINSFSSTLAIRGKRAVKEMLQFWKRNEKEEREARKRAEKEAQEAIKREEELREAKRQQRKLNFLITQTELYSHFIGNKSAQVAALEGKSKSDDVSEIDFDNDNEQELAEQAKLSAQRALMKQRDSTKHFDEQASKLRREADGSLNVDDELDFLNPSSMKAEQDVGQPQMLQCELKNYQLKGLNWLASLYEQGINGILADEMGLGKTVQSISLMAYLAETHNIWGPFLVITPVSTLHNWQQEILKFAPELKPLPYWGSQTDRRVLRQFWNRKKLYSREAPFHVLVTSYQLVVTDERYFQKVKWQYMVLDEAQAIKSSTSQRWNTLLKFNCRNRLLLTGTPIQNSMHELWNLLHFIMPTLFDSHEEFSDWFARDIESHSKDNGNLDEHQLKRLHMILKPFMLRRVKRDVQNELGEKIEVELMCPLSARQKRMYYKLKERISVAELLEKAKSISNNDVITSSLMNLYMQFRKVCNHPELFEREQIKSPFFMTAVESIKPVIHLAPDMDVPFVYPTSQSPITFTVPRLMYDEYSFKSKSRTAFVENLCNLYACDTIGFALKNVASDCSKALFVEESTLSILGLFGLHSRVIYHLLKSDSVYNWGLYLLLYRAANAIKCYGQLMTGSQSHFDNLLILPVSDQLSLLPRRYSPVISDLCSVASDLKELGAAPRRLDRAYVPRALSAGPKLYCNSRRFAHLNRLPILHLRGRYIPHETVTLAPRRLLVEAVNRHELSLPRDKSRSLVVVPSMQRFIAESGKLLVLDRLLPKLKQEGHRVLIYFQMTKMIDLMEEYLTYSQQSYLRLDGSTSIGQRRDMVHDFQTKRDIFIFLLSTRAGGLGINLTAADTVIFYESDWNPTVDQQAMDRAHRLGQTRQVTVYRLITQGTVEQKILIRAKQKDLIQKTVISGGDFKQQDLPSANDMVSLLLDEDDMEERPSNANKQANGQNSAATGSLESSGKAFEAKPFLSRGSRKSKKIPKFQDRFKLSGSAKKSRSSNANKAAPKAVKLDANSAETNGNALPLANGTSAT